MFFKNFFFQVQNVSYRDYPLDTGVKCGSLNRVEIDYKTVLNDNSGEFISNAYLYSTAVMSMVREEEVNL